MSTTIKLRRSAVAGRVPTTSQLELGEIAINTTDGKLYFKKYDPVSNTESIIDVSADLDANAILDLLSGVDGANSGLDADLLDGQDGSYYLDYNNFTNVPPATFDLTLDGKVTGTAFSNTGIMTLVTELANTGVTAGTYGSASEVPVLVVDEDGRITAANTVSVAGVSNTYWDSSNNTYTIETADGGVFDTVIDQFSDLTINGATGRITFDSVVAPEITNGDNTVRIVMFGDGYTPDTAQLYLWANTNVWVDTDLSITGDIVVGGLVDGRDIAADGAKLDLLEDGLDLTLEGKVTGFASSNTGVMTLQTELANTGVIAGVYGSSTAIPVFTVDEDGRLTTANTTPVAGVDNFSYAAANNTITLETGDGSVFNIQTETEVTLTGKVTGTATATDGNLSIATELANTGVVAGEYGSSTSIPVLTIDEDGRVTVANTAAVAGVNDFYWTSANNTLTLETGDGSSYLVPIQEFNEITANTVNGRDISADGLKLDGIEPGATADQTASEILALLLTVDGDSSGLDADKLDGFDAGALLDEAANNAASLIGNGRVDVQGGTGIDGSGFFNLNDANNTIITLSHGDTSSVANSDNSNGVVIQDLTFDAFGHVQTVGTLDLDSRYYTEAELDAGALDNRYYTEIESDAKYVDVTGDTMTGNLTVNADILQQHSRFISTSVTTTSTSQATLYSAPYAGISGAEFLITAIDGTDKHITKLLVTHDGSTAIATEFGTVYTNSVLADFDVEIDGFLLSLNVIPASSASTVFKVIATLIDA